MQGDDETPTRIEQYWEADSDDDAEKPKSAFPLEDAVDARDNENGDMAVPASAEEYIRSVRKEAAALPDVFSTATRVPERTSHVIPLTISLAPTPDHLRPCETWVEEQLATFRELQSQIFKHPAQSGGDSGESGVPKDTAGWKRLFLSTTRDLVLSALSTADYNAIACALRAFDERLQDDGRDAKTKWLYALLVRISPPLDGSTAATMRSILRKLTYARLNVASTESPELGSLNLLISIISIHFKQG